MGRKSAAAQQPKERMVERITALLNTAAEGSGATDAERDTALRLAVELMHKNAIEESDLRMSTTEADVEHRVYDAFVASRFEVKEWRRWVAHGVAKAFMVKSYNMGTDRFIFVGRPADLDVAEQVFYSLRNQLQQACDVAAAASLKDKLHGGHGAKGGLDPLAWRKNFLEAAAQVLHSRLEDLAEANTGTPGDQINAIVIVNDAAIDEYMKGHFAPVKSVKSKHSAGARNFDAIAMGREAGQNAHISAGVEAGESTPAERLTA